MVTVFRRIGGRVVPIVKNPSQVMEQVERIHKLALSRGIASHKSEKISKKMLQLKEAYLSHFHRKPLQGFRLPGIKSDSPISKHILFREAKSVAKWLRKSR